MFANTDIVQVFFVITFDCLHVCVCVHVCVLGLVSRRERLDHLKVLLFEGEFRKYQSHSSSLQYGRVDQVQRSKKVKSTR